MGLEAGIVKVYTIGHSTRSLEAFLALLQTHGVELLVDVRSFPRSRRNPQFNLETLGPELAKAGIGYLHFRELGGMRRPRPDSANTAWQVDGFRGYADHMATPEFAAGLAGLLEAAAGRQTAVMCAEAVPWECHRQLLADALVARSVPVEHILGEGRREAHQLSPYARITGVEVTYPGIMSAL